MHVDVDKKYARRVEERGGVQQTTSYAVFHEQLVGIVGRLTRQLVDSTGTRNSQSLDKRLLCGDMTICLGICASSLSAQGIQGFYFGKPLSKYK